jgi:hypothetical protein
MVRFALFGVLLFVPSAMAEPIPKTRVNRHMPLRDGMKVVYSSHVTEERGTIDLGDSISETKKTKSNEEGTFFVVTNTPKDSILSERNYLVTKDRKVFQIQDDTRIEIPQIYQMKVGTEFKQPFFVVKSKVEVDAKIEAEEEIEVLGKKYLTTRFSNHYKSSNFDFHSIYWITDGDGPGIVKQVSDAAGLKVTHTLKEYVPGRK